ncbi:hypothetical protein C8J56DRAFT_813027 [Mycena floridula]|nr:hypothetical protein C8J56DRAFT_813027 [Mycena floridula]
MDDNRPDFGGDQEQSSLQNFDDGPLQVDSAPNRKPGAGIRILSSATVLVAFIFLSTTLFIHGRRGYSSTYSSTFPHIARYQNQTLEQVQNRSLVVQPLIGRDQTFDIAVSIWLLRPGRQNHNLYESNTGWPMKLKPARFGFGQVLDEDWLYTYNRLEENEQAIYSQIVFRGLRLKDKDVHTEIQFQLPTEVFRDYVSRGDLRASFVLIPSSPSLMDHFHSYSATESPLSHPWERRRLWSYPFPLGSTDKRHRTEAELALESFAFSVPLIRRLEIPRKCPITTKQDEDNVLPWLGLSRSRNEQLFQDHPFIVTRTQLRVADETHLFNKEAFDKARMQLGRYICFGASNCKRQYRYQGHLESLFELSVPNETPESGFQTEYAYPPYLSHFGENIGPNDLLRVPISQEKCPDGDDDSKGRDSEPEFMNVTWHLSYSGRSPSKMLLGELYQSKAPKLFRTRNNQSASEYEKAVFQSQVEALNGLFGHRHGEDIHPRRRLFIFGLLLPVFSFLTWTLEILFWHRCTSTEFISVPGTALIAIARVFSLVATIMESVAAETITATPQSLTFLAWKVIVGLLIPFLMFVSILRVDFTWRRWIPWLRRVRATHAERSSRRLDSRTTPLARFAILVTLCILYLVSTDSFVLDPFPSPPEAASWYSDLQIFATALRGTGQIFQLVLNQRSRAFAGTFKATVWLEAVRYLLYLTSFFPVLLGTLQLSEGISMTDFIWVLTWLIPAAYQAIMLPGPNVEDTKSA